MPTLQEKGPKRHENAKREVPCYHCGTPCAAPAASEKAFCCDGCRLVYDVLNDAGLCDYYKLQDHPGLSQIKPIRKAKYAFLDEAAIAQKLYTFTDGQQASVTLYIPGVHCSSCMWLLEHMSRLNPAILESRLNFSAKEVSIRFRLADISLREVVELLTTIGYEPYISLNETEGKKAKKIDRSRVLKLGVAGFCFGNIMMMSFPEYFSGLGIEEEYALLFRYLNLALAIPVFFYCASEFFVSAWKGLKQRQLNIDAPIALSLVMTFSRSLYEILSGTGGGFLDSMSGIVFFMLVGRVVQERTYRNISFHRDYKSYFPIAVDVVTEGGTESRALQDLQPGEQVVLHYDEIVPADAVVMGERARIDYSFVTGESDPVVLPEGQTVYAGGRNAGEDVVVKVVKPVAASYLTSLWNHSAFQRDKVGVSKDQSIIHKLSRYFTIVLFTLAAITGIFWAVNDPSKVLPSVTAMLIVACPCALLLSATYTNGNLLRIFSNNGLFLRDAVVIENLGKIDQIVFDKTGTLTEGTVELHTEGRAFSEEEAAMVRAVASPSKHPLSRALLRHVGLSGEKAALTEWSETAGAGVRGIVNGREVRIGSALFTGTVEGPKKAAFYVRIDDAVTPFFSTPAFRPGMSGMLGKLRQRFRLALLSGDNDRHKAELAPLFGEDLTSRQGVNRQAAESNLRFNQQPMDKLAFIESLQGEGRQVLMIGDGLNDAGALQQSNVGITLADDVNNFTPGCDAILDATRFAQLPALLKLARAGRWVIYSAFICSILYNIVGLTISVQGLMSPLIAAILMPVSTLSIVLITTGASTLVARALGLKK